MEERRTTQEKKKLRRIKEEFQAVLVLRTHRAFVCVCVHAAGAAESSVSPSGPR